jgi:hypothetical protein
MAEVESIDGPRITLSLRRLSDDAGPFPDTAAFALRLLHLPALGIGTDGTLTATGPLGEAVSEDDVHDEAWMAAHADDYVAAVRHDGGAYAIEATDPRWLAHLAPGERWRSAAY